MRRLESSLYTSSISSFVGWAKARLRRAHHLSTIAVTMVGTLRFAHPTNSSASFPKRKRPPSRSWRPSLSRGVHPPVATTTGTHCYATVEVIIGDRHRFMTLKAPRGQVLFNPPYCNCRLSHPQQDKVRCHEAAGSDNVENDAHGWPASLIKLRVGDPDRRQPTAAQFE